MKLTQIPQVKPNIGHGEGAAGLSSLIKAVLSLERNTIPPNIKFTTPNPKSMLEPLMRHITNLLTYSRSSLY